MTAVLMYSVQFTHNTVLSKFNPISNTNEYYSLSNNIMV